MGKRQRVMAHDLDVTRPNQTLYSLTTAVIETPDAKLADFEPDWVLVHRDSATALAAILAAFHRSIPAVHGEAGLRTKNLNRPFPEEFSRRCVDVVASHLRFPTNGFREYLGKNDDPDCRQHGDRRADLGRRRSPKAPKPCPTILQGASRLLAPDLAWSS